MEWEVLFNEDENGVSPVEDWINEFEEKIQVKIFESIQRLELFGLNLVFPNCSHIEDEIWELRIQYGKNKYRILYFADTD